MGLHHRAQQADPQSGAKGRIKRHPPSGLKMLHKTKKVVCCSTIDAIVKLLLDGSVRRLAISSVPTRQERRIRNAAISFGIAVRGSAVTDHDGKVRPVVYTTPEAYRTKAALTNANGCNIRDRATWLLRPSPV